MKSVGVRIRKERERQNLTQEELAEKLGISKSFVTQMEDGQKPISLIRLMEIGDLLSIDFFEHTETEEELFLKWKPVIERFEEKKVEPELILSFMRVLEKL